MTNRMGYPTYQPWSWIFPPFLLLFLRRGFNFPAHRNLRVSEGVENLLR